MIEVTHLDSGLTVVTERMDHVRSVALGFWVGIGARDESDAEAGASHFLEHLLFKGTSDRSARDIAEAVDAVGGDINAFTTKEYTAFEAHVLDDAAVMAFGILSDIVWSPALRAGDIDIERHVILEELAMQGDDPADEAHDLAAAALFPDHPLGRSVLGTEPTVDALGRQAIAGFHATHYRPAVTVLAGAGRIDHDWLVDAASDGLPVAGGSRPLRLAPGARVDPVALIERDTEQVHLVVGSRSIDRDDDDRYALLLLEHAMGGGLSSRLFQEIREQRGLSYSVYSWQAAYAETGAFGVYAGTAPANVAEVLGVINATLDDVRARGITDREIAVAKGHVRGSLALGLEDSAARMGRIARHQLVHGRVPTVDDVLARIDAVASADLRRVADRVLSNPRVVAAVGPIDGASLRA